jgi:CDP-6-deoxy-D-xylo-4-hexulose-3-dehydrase
VSGEDQVKEQIKNLIKLYYETKSPLLHYKGKYRIPLSVPPFDWEEVAEAVDVLLSTYVTMGEKVRKFEELFANYLGSKEAIMVNSGSSANLLVLNILSNPILGDNAIKPGDEVLVPAVAWSTSIFPIINIGAVPVLVDVDLETLSIVEEELEEGVSDKTKAIMVVHLLGFPCNMEKILNIARKFKLFVIEDSCEAHGAEWNGRKVGTFGDMGTFSFYFSHHITTIEGGMIVTDNEEYAELARVLRAHGWVRDLKRRDQIISKYPEIDPRFLFINIGFNVRPTEIQGAFGIHQIKKLEKFIEIRRENAKYWNEHLSMYSDYFIIYNEKENSRAVWFGYPITIKPRAPFTRRELVNFLESHGIETRPLVAGNMEEQPAMKLFRYRKVSNLTNSRIIMRNSIVIGNHHGIREKEREYLVKIIKDFLKEKVGRYI